MSMNANNGHGGASEFGTSIFDRAHGAMDLSADAGQGIWGKTDRGHKGYAHGTRREKQGARFSRAPSGSPSPGGPSEGKKLDSILRAQTKHHLQFHRQQHRSKDPLLTKLEIHTATI